MTRSTLFLELRRSRTLVIGMALVTLAYGGIMGAMYPILKQNQALLDEYMKVFPKELMAAFGMSGTLTDPGVFFTTYISSWLWPIIAAIVGIIIATRATAAGIVAGVLIAMYLLNVVVQIQPDFEVLGYLGLFRYLDTTEIISDGTVPWGDLAVLAAVALAGWGLATWRFRTRDLLA